MLLLAMVNDKDTLGELRQIAALGGCHGGCVRTGGGWRTLGRFDHFRRFQNEGPQWPFFGEQKIKTVGEPIQTITITNVFNFLKRKSHPLLVWSDQYCTTIHCKEGRNDEEETQNDCCCRSYVLHPNMENKPSYRFVGVSQSVMLP